MGVTHGDKKGKKGDAVRDLQVQEKLSLKLEAELRERICKKCDFYKEDEEDLECYAFKLSKKLIEDGKLTLGEL